MVGHPDIGRGGERRELSICECRRKLTILEFFGIGEEEVPLLGNRRIIRFELRGAWAYNFLPTSFPPGGNMPRHEYFCHACKKPFSKTLTPAEYEEGGVVCPHCGSEEVEEPRSAFYPISPKKTA